MAYFIRCTGWKEACMIGPQVSNALVTSSICLGRWKRFCINWWYFISFHARYNQGFLGIEDFYWLNSLKSVKALIEDPSATHVADIAIIFHQMRQIRTNFHPPSTCSLRRASDPITINHICHPFSLQVNLTVVVVHLHVYFAQLLVRFYQIHSNAKLAPGATLGKRCSPEISLPWRKIKYKSKQSSTQEINDNNTQKVADTTTQDLDDKCNDS